MTSPSSPFGNPAASAGDENSAALGFELPDDAWLQLVGEYRGIDGLGAFGEYRLEAEIGRGGQGVVYRARQPRTGRIVAIKRLSAGVFSTIEMRARFEREIEAAATLDHPGIVTVFGSEVIDGLPVLAMQWVDGIPVDRWARLSTDVSQTGVSGRQSVALSKGIPRCETQRPVAEIFRLFVRICGAMQHAHQRGVIHRDLKPSNILVDSRDQPHILDFGLAKLQQPLSTATALTQTGEFIGTLIYAAPEQLRGELADVRSDVYSLGVVLYVALTGKLPFAVPTNVAELIRHQEVPAPSRCRLSLNVEIDAIVLKATSIDADRRYPSVEALRADLLRYLSGETVTAHLPTRSYRMRKYVRRHWRAIAVAGAVGAMLFASAVVSTALYWKSETLRAAESTQRGTAEQVSAFLREILMLADPAQTRGARLTVREMLSKAVARADGGILADYPLAEADVRATIGATFTSLGLYADAEAQLRRAVAIQARLLGSENIATLHTQSQIVDALLWQTRYAEAAELGRRTLESQRRAAGFEHADTLRTQILLGRSLTFLGELGQAQELLTGSVEALQRILGPEHPQTADAMDSLGMALAWSGRPAEAKPLHEKSLEIHRKALGEDHPDTLFSINFLATAYLATGDAPASLSLFRTGHETALRVLGPDHLATMALMANYVNALQALGRHAEAEPIAQQLVDSHARTLGGTHAHTLMCQHGLAQTLIALERFEPAAALLRNAIATATATYGANHNDTTLTLQSDLAALYGRQARPQEEEALLRSIYEARRTGLGAAHPQTIESVRALISNLRRQGRDQDAAPLETLLPLDAPASAAAERPSAPERRP